MSKKKVAPSPDDQDKTPPITLAVPETAGDPSFLFKDILIQLCKLEGSDGLAKNWDEAHMQYSLGVAQGAEKFSNDLEEQKVGLEKERQKAERKREKKNAARPSRSPSRSCSPSRGFPAEHSSPPPRAMPPNVGHRSDELGCHEAGPYFRKGAMFQRDPMHQYYYGECFLLGDGLSTNDAVARSWFEKAAAQSYSPAECKLGTMMIQGKGGPRDVPAGYKLWEKAAAAREPNAIANLAAFAQAINCTDLV